MTPTDKQEPVALKPCPLPWCGCDNPQVIRWGPKEYEVRCPARFCGCHGPLRDTEAEAITAWNTRPTPDLAERIEGLVERLEACPDINYARLVPISQRETEYILPASLKFAILAALKEVNNG